MNLNSITFLISLFVLTLSISSSNAASQDKPKQCEHPKKLSISQSGHYFIYEDNTPFFMLADTGWALFNRLTIAQAKLYLKDRSKKKFNTIQTFLTAQWMPKNTSNETLFINDNPLQLNTKYLGHVNEVIKLAADENIYILLSIGEVFRLDSKDWYLKNENNSYEFGKLLARNLGHNTNLIWSLGQDFNPKDFKKTKTDVRRLVRATAKGIAFELNQNPKSKNYNSLLMSFHPNGLASSSKWFHNDSWLDFNMIQTGHSKQFNNFIIKKTRKDYHLQPSKPVIESESPYEDIQSYQSIKRGTHYRFTDHDVRVAAYWSVFSGAAGFTYGHNNIWQFWDNGPFEGTNYWQDSLNSKGANQMRHLIDLINIRPVSKCLSDQLLLVNETHKTKYKKVAMRAIDSSYALVYSPIGESIIVNTNRISSKGVKTWWYNPRNGDTIFNGIFPGSYSSIFNPPGAVSNSKDHSKNDWILILDDVTAKLARPSKDNHQ